MDTFEDHVWAEDVKNNSYITVRLLFLMIKMYMFIVLIVTYF